MKVSRFTIAAVAALSVLALASCQKEGTNWDELDPSNQSVVERNEDATKFVKTSVVWLGASDEFYTHLAERANSIKTTVSSDDKIIFSDIANIKTNLLAIREAYSNGAALIMRNPDVVEALDLLEENGWKHLCPSEGDPIFYGISKNGAFALMKPVSCTPETIVTEEPGAEATYANSEDDAQGDTPSDEIDFSKVGYYVKPLVAWVNGIVEPHTKASDTEELEPCSFEYVMTWKCDLYVHHVAASSDDRIKGIYQAGVVYKYKPLYAQKIQEGGTYGDFYKFQADYSSNTGDKSTGGVWYGNNYVNKHGGIRVHITGAFTREVSYTTYIDGDGNYPYFYCSPQPATDNNKVNYSETSGFNIGGGVTGGISSTKGTQMGKPMSTFGKTGSASFNWGYSETSTVSKTVSDVSVTNRSSDSYNGHGAAAGWKFIYGNLPKPKGDKAFDGDCPESAHSYQSFPTQWVWNSKSHDEGTFDSLGELVTIVEPVLGAVHNGLCVDGENNTWNLGKQEVRTVLAVPNRISFGTAKIINSLDDNYVMHDIIITSISDEEGVEPEVVFTDTSDYPSGKGVEFSLPVGKYDITFLMYNKTTKKHEKYVLDDTDPAYSYRPYIMQKRTKEDDVKLLDISVRFRKVTE